MKIHYCPNCGLDIESLTIENAPICEQCKQCGRNKSNKNFCQYGLPMRNNKRKQCKWFIKVKNEN